MAKKKKEYKIGVDIGGTKMLAVLFDGTRVVEEYTLATPKDSVEHFVIMINALIEPFFEIARKDKIEITGMGLGIAGVLDSRSRKITKSPNISVIEGTDFLNKLEQKLSLPVFIDNDARCFLRAEVLVGIAKKYKNVSGVVIGTGIGGAWWNEGQAYLGANGSAGEIGHNIIDIDNKTTLEQAYQNLTQRNPFNMSTEAYKGDVLAIKSFEEFGRILGFSLASLINTTNPEVIVLGGGGMGASDLFLAETKKTIKEYTHAEEARKTKILISKLGKHAGAIGASLLVE